MGIMPCSVLWHPRQKAVGAASAEESQVSHLHVGFILSVSFAYS